MNPWDILAWVAALALTMLVVLAVVVIIVAVIQALAKPAGNGRHVYRGRGDR